MKKDKCQTFIFRKYLELTKKKYAMYLCNSYSYCLYSHTCGFDKHVNYDINLEEARVYSVYLYTFVHVLFFIR